MTTQIDPFKNYIKFYFCITNVGKATVFVRKDCLDMKMDELTLVYFSDIFLREPNSVYKFFFKDKEIPLDGSVKSIGLKEGDTVYIKKTTVAKKLFSFLSL